MNNAQRLIAQILARHYGELTREARILLQAAMVVSTDGHDSETTTLEDVLEQTRLLHDSINENLQNENAN